MSLGSRILGGDALKGGMPPCRYVANRLLTLAQNLMTGMKLSEYHTGYRGFTSEVLRTLPLHLNDDDFIFDNQMLLQSHYAGFRIAEITCPTKYFDDASSINLRRSAKYGLLCLWNGVLYLLARLHAVRGADVQVSCREGSSRRGSPMEPSVLTDPDIRPGEDVIASHIGKRNAPWDALFRFIHAEHPDFVATWRYYNDGKSWLLNVSRKKKTVFWLGRHQGHLQNHRLLHGQGGGRHKGERAFGRMQAAVPGRAAIRQARGHHDHVQEEERRRRREDPRRAQDLMTDTIRRNARTCSGVVPQQPPTMSTPRGQHALRAVQP